MIVEMVEMMIKVGNMTGVLFLVALAGIRYWMFFNYITMIPARRWCVPYWTAFGPAKKAGLIVAYAAVFALATAIAYCFMAETCNCVAIAIFAAAWPAAGSVLSASAIRELYTSHQDHIAYGLIYDPKRERFYCPNYR